MGAVGFRSCGALLTGEGVGDRSLSEGWKEGEEIAEEVGPASLFTSSFHLTPTGFFEVDGPTGLEGCWRSSGFGSGGHCSTSNEFDVFVAIAA